jgi:hypothetical protein
MKAKTIAYWVTTGSIAFSIGSGGLAAALRVPGVVDGHGGRSQARALSRIGICARRARRNAVISRVCSI